ncbi:MAG: hypothetical protein COZ07_08425 [Candidatus Infernicultor aquiphilus]|uniref:Uncharacterized protein n=1 Tax=Candidatus Infernicultor aquiphilus TaxID=1805029 RepID=A0A1J5G4N4_9BACT|nr:hypothetical protein [bacterium]OIP67565.1 MAG: hypothetical protein AUK42_06865 [Candidatus Atribacteria bacterium CG2_30_33_13]PIU24713.1 MAG: hypothetical protein COT11_06570 [Candidatus Atribacteria bacterium CG08_land_8_20_14_0_20_33_29]PIW12442.1 MAG: hypothetical protein COW35_01505 [Candidatus Atribacteria bacterium CG17_big_fil_post_rev_8_21_14_2_50_34_11]PIX34861.1 MAG: hypothetical protein COZ58_02295 [Candidatus Atribacteria bacterium CG_4_8_14_3_um_filter_34_18]PIY31687.1 MAG: 
MNCIINKDDIDNAITKTCIEIIQEPLLYFSEADNQQLLAEGLKKIEALKKLYPTLVHKGKNSKSFYKTSLLHREYGGGAGTRIDIVIFSENDVKQIDDLNLKIGKKYITPEFAFELGTEKTINIEKHLINDIKKLNKVRNTGYIIHIYKDRTKSPTGTKKRDNTVEKIKNAFKIVFENNKCTNGKIKKLAILLSPFKDQTLTKGKCKIFNGNIWENVNVADKSALRKKIIDQLN